MLVTRKLLVDQISAHTGKAYSPELSQALESRGFASRYWLCQTGLRMLGVKLLGTERNRSFCIYKTPIYNAAQTTDPEKVQRHAGRIRPLWAIGRSYISSAIPLLQENGENLWISAAQIDALGLTLKANAEAAEAEIRQNGNRIKCSMYPLRALKNAENLSKILTKDHFNASAGISMTEMDERMPILRDVLHKTYKSDLWVTARTISDLGLSLKENETPTKVPNFDKAEDISLFNADQFDSQDKIAELAEKRRREHISGYTGKPLPDWVSAALEPIMAQNPGWSRYWAPFADAVRNKHVRPRQQQTVVRSGEKFRVFFNAAQMQDDVPEKFRQAHRREIAAPSDLPDGVTLDGKRFSPSAVQTTDSTEYLKAVGAAIQKSAKWRTHWMTADFMKRIGAVLKTGEEPLTFTFEGKTLELYAADQLVDRAVFDTNTEWALPQVAGPTGKYLPLSVSDALAAHVRRRPMLSRYWVTMAKARKWDAVLPHSKPFWVDTDKGRILWYNAAQLKPWVMEYCVKAHEEAKRSAPLPALRVE